MALRGMYMGLISTTQDIIKANIDFEESLARIRTVVSANSTSIEADMSVVTQKILDLGLTTRVPLKELANAMYFLRSADLTTAESIDALDSVLNLAVGTMNSVEESARAVAGIYNTMGDALGENLTQHEKFQKISDVLAFTYSVQEVQLNELLAGYSKLAPFIGGLSDSFLELTTLLGVLNTRLLKAGRTGTLTAQTILQLTKGSRQLAEVFKITFDPNQPISLIKTLEEMNKVFNRQGKLTFEQSQMLGQLFGARGIVVPQLLLASGGFENLSEAIALATQNAEGYAKRMREIRELTVQAQLERTKNILAILAIEFLNNAVGASNFAKSLKDMNDNLAKSKDKVKEAGITTAFYKENIMLLTEALAFYANQIKQIPVIGQLFKGGEKVGQVLRDLRSWLNPLKILGTTFEKVGIPREEIANRQQALKDEFELQKKLAQASERLPEERKRLTEERDQRTLKSIKQELEHQVNIMKALGASALDVARIREEAFKDEEAFMQINDREFEAQERHNDVLEEELKIRKQIKDEVLEAQLDILKMLGASELDILKAKEKELINSKGLISDSQLLLELSQNRLQQEVALVAEKQKEWDLASSLFQQFVKADDLGKENLRRVMELVQLKPDELAQQYNTNMFDKNLIDDYFNSFSQLGQDAINKVRAEMFDLPVEIPEVGQFDTFREAFPLDLANQFGLNLESGMLKAVESFKQAFQEAMQTVLISSKEPKIPQVDLGLGQIGMGTKKPKEGLGRTVKEISFKDGQRIERDLPAKQPILRVENMTIDVRGEKTEELGEQVKQKFMKELDSISTQKKIAKVIRPHLEV
jgi:TP901 family phage tail tape measure protein